MVSFYGMGYAGLLLYITRKQTAVNGRIYGYTAYHKSKKVTSEAHVYLGRTQSGGVYYRVRTLPNTLSSVPLPSTLPHVGSKVQF